MKAASASSVGVGLVAWIMIGVAPAAAGEIFSSGQGTGAPDAHINSDADGRTGTGAINPQFLAVDFVLTAPATIRSVRWEGTYSSNTPPASDTFQIVIYANAAGGGPGPVLSRTLALDPGRTDTGFNESGSDVYAYQANIARTDLPAGTYWVSIANKTPSNGFDTWSMVVRFGDPGGPAPDYTSHEDTDPVSPEGYGKPGSYSAAGQDFGATIALYDTPVDEVFSSGQGAGVPTAHYNSDADFPVFVAVDVVLTAQTTLRSVTWEGTYNPPSAGLPSADAFRIVVYDASGSNGSPGVIVGQVLDVNPGRANTGLIEQGTNDVVYSYAATIPPLTLSPGVYWISIANDTAMHSSTWSWSTRSSDPGGRANEQISTTPNPDRVGKSDSFVLFGNPDAGVTVLLAGSVVPNTPDGGGGAVTVEPIDSTTGTFPVELVFSNLTAGGQTSLTTSSSGPPPPSGFQFPLGPTSSVYYELTTTATFNGAVQISISYDPNFSGTPELFHFENGEWVQITTTFDGNTHVVTGSVESLSPFAVFEAIPTHTACPRGQGYWKNHAADWPVVTSLTLGGRSYTQAELLEIFNTPPRGDASLILAHQLIAAKLNVANGTDPLPVAVTITEADALLANQPRLGTPQPKTKGKGNDPNRQAMVRLAELLDAYNNTPCDQSPSEGGLAEPNNASAGSPSSPAASSPSSPAASKPDGPALSSAGGSGSSGGCSLATGPALDSSNLPAGLFALLVLGLLRRRRQAPCEPTS